MIIRELRKEDAASLAEIEQAVFGKNAWRQEDFIETLAMEYTYYLVAEDEEGRLIGECGYRDMCVEADITNVCVVSEFRRQGIAERLLKQLMEYGYEKGVADYTLEVRASNAAAIALYEKLGFRSEGVRPGFYDNPKDDAVIMWKRRKALTEENHA